MTRSHTWSIAIAAALALAAPLSAQQVPDGDAGFAAITASMQTMAPVATLVPVTAFGSTFVTEAFPGEAIAPIPAMRQSQSVALMIVGGAGMIVGSIIDGDTGTIIMVGGGAVGLVGLYNYLR